MLVDKLIDIVYLCTYMYVCIFQLEVITEEWIHYRAAVLSEKLLETEFTTRNRGRIYKMCYY